MQDREAKVILIFLLVCLSFLYGAVSVALEIFPFSAIKAPLAALSSVQKALALEEYGLEIRWSKPAPVRTGVIEKKPGLYQQGYTLLTTTHDSTTRLIDDDGALLHSWPLEFNDVWGDKSHIISLVPIEDRHIYIRDAHLYSNGDVLVLVTIGGTTPWGIGMAKLDKDANVLWTYSGYVNNDFHVAADGNIYVVEHRIRENKPEHVDTVFLPFLEDNIVTLSPGGDVLQRISLIDALDASSFSAVLKQFTNDGAGDPTHSNSIEEVLADSIEVPWLKKGYLLISVRNLNALVVLDPKAGTVVHAMALRTRMQHDIDLLENGHLMLFDNQGDIEGAEYTRVIEFDPQTQEIMWQYNGGDGEEELHSQFFGEQQRLPNGNTLITNAEAGALREVNAQGEIVWRYRLPLTVKKDGVDYIATITSAAKLPRDYVNFNF